MEKIWKAVFKIRDAENGVRDLEECFHNFLAHLICRDCDSETKISKDLSRIALRFDMIRRSLEEARDILSKDEEEKDKSEEARKEGE